MPGLARLVTNHAGLDKKVAIAFAAGLSGAETPRYSGAERLLGQQAMAADSASELGALPSGKVPTNAALLPASPHQYASSPDGLAPGDMLAMGLVPVRQLS